MEVLNQKVGHIDTLEPPLCWCTIAMGMGGGGGDGAKGFTLIET